MGEQRTDMGKSAGTKINTTDENEINELLQELSDCREDERNTANQILSVIGAAGAMLGAILTANIFSASGDKDEVVKAIFLTISVSKQSMIWFSFVLSNTIFCTAFAYVITLGISAALRYHYIRNIEDRLSILIPEENKTSGMGNFVHWTSYSGAFITRVPKHVQGINGWSYFIGYTIAAVGASFFGILMTIILFLMLDEKRVVDYCLLSVPILEIGWAIIAFIAASRGLTKSAERYFEIARARRKERQNKYQKEIENRKNQEKLDSEKETWLKLEFLMYLLYPKTKDFQKALLIPLGYALYTFWMANVPDFQGALLALKSNWKSLFWAMLIFDFLFYQARFQINDICGLKKDIKAEKPPIAGMKGASNEIIGKMVIVSFLVAVVRIMAGIALLYRMPLYSKARMVCCVIILFGVTIIYEVLRTVEDGDKAKEHRSEFLCLLDLVIRCVSWWAFWRRERFDGTNSCVECWGHGTAMGW